METRKLIGLVLLLAGLTLGFGSIWRRKRGHSAKGAGAVMTLAFVMEGVGIALLAGGCGGE
ncbi:hypothetical protein [Chitinophaga deserti]|uniref:hypothetical protein n=1 Tax=Chitinophaga deserti TaxID=2164099 RepID=UPI000D6B16E9|nr:hypothetical protein [Chitinophaga deserti]